MDDSKVTEDAEDSSAATVGLFADINGNATCAVTPRPEIARNCVVSPNVRCFSCAPATIAAARRMFGIPFGTGGNRQQIIRHFAPFSKRKHVGQRWRSSGDRACFVKHDGIDFAAGFQCFGGTDQHAHLRGTTSRNRYGKRRGKTQRARACDQQHRNRSHQRMHHAWFRPKRKPQRARPHGNQHHNRHENA